MDPLSVLKVVWRFRRLAAPVLALVALAALYTVFFGPRTYESAAIYVIANPNAPTQQQIEDDSRLAQLNDDNPYLRASDSSLIVKVLVSKMSAQSTQQAIEDAGLSTDYTIGQSPSSTMTVLISAFGDSPAAALNSRAWLLDRLKVELYDLQKVNGADDRYLFTALPVDVAEKPTEKVSSRLRSLILVLGGGMILLMGVVSIAAAVDRRPSRSRRARGVPDLDRLLGGPLDQTPASDGPARTVRTTTSNQSNEEDADAFDTPEAAASGRSRAT